VGYPLRCEFLSFQATNAAELIEEDGITEGVFRVLQHRGDRTTYILKAVNRFLYLPRDSDVIRKELEKS
jgi:hypothetical protein